MAAPGGVTSLPAVTAPGRSITSGLARLRRATPTERREWRFALVLLLPAVLMIGTFVAYPFVRGIWLSLTDTVVGREGDFVGLSNFVKLWNDSIFQQAARNTVFYTAAATVLKLIVGMVVALMLNTLLGFKRILRASMLLPWIVPTVLSTLAWKWMLDPTFSILNWVLFQLGLIRFRVDWLGGPVMALWSVILVNVWRGTPFFAITLLAGLQTISPEVYEAASIDGANAWQRFWTVTWPLLMPVTMVDEGRTADPMKAMRFPEPGRAEIVDIPLPVPAEGEMLVRVRAAGICASDVAAFAGTHAFRRPPVITGHEFAGEIVQVGPGVRTRKLGERVAVEPHLGCGTCSFCRQGQYHECPSKRFVGVGDWMGAFAEYAVVAEPMCHVMPAQMTWEEGAALEPLCVGLHAVRRAGLRMGERVAVLGAGTIGMMALLCVCQAAPGWVAVTDPSRFKREMALRSGGDLAIDPMTTDPVKTILAATDGFGVDVVFLAVAAEPALRQAVDVCRRMGRLVVIASFFQGGLVAIREVQWRERVFIGTSMYTAEDYRLAIRLWERGALGKLPTLITDRIALEQAPVVVAAMARGARPDAIKTTILFS